jgi:coenzyme A diphosphatase NUDT7
MDIKSIKDRLKNFKPKPMDYEVSFAVLVPLIEIDGELNIIYEVRSNSITQPGEISFPGGRIEEGESPQEAAIRETSEELLLNKANIEIIRELNYASSKSGVFVFTFLGLIKDLDPYEIGYNTDEVSEVFFVPLSFFLDNKPEKIEEARQSMMDGTFNVFDGVIETNDGSTVGEEGKTLDDATITGGINWYFKTVVEK